MCLHTFLVNHRRWQNNSNALHNVLGIDRTKLWRKGSQTLARHDITKHPNLYLVLLKVSSRQYIGAVPIERPIILKIEGGLGNQLFQFSAGYYLAAKLSKDLVIDQYSIPLSTHHGERKLGFAEFVWPELPNEKSIKVLPLTPNLFTTQAAKRSETFKRVLTKLRMFTSNPHSLPIFSETDDIQDFLSLSEAKKVHGNFQSWKIVEAASSVGFPRSLELRNVSNWIPVHLGQIDLTNSIAVHFRVGADALGNQSFSQPTTQYYQEALALLGASAEMANVFVFSDDLDLAKEKFGGILGSGCHYVYQPNSAPPAEKIFHLSRFKNIICANSTFCGWAGWSIGNSGGKVVVPVPYSDTSALGSRDFPSDWIKLSKKTGNLVVE